jgi:hypothetical protein
MVRNVQLPTIQQIKTIKLININKKYPTLKPLKNNKLNINKAIYLIKNHNKKINYNHNTNPIKNNKFLMNNVTLLKIIPTQKNKFIIKKLFYLKFPPTKLSINNPTLITKTNINKNNELANKVKYLPIIQIQNNNSINNNKRYRIINVYKNITSIPNIHYLKQTLLLQLLSNTHKSYLD